MAGVHFFQLRFVIALCEPLRASGRKATALRQSRQVRWRPFYRLYTVFYVIAQFRYRS